MKKVKGQPITGAQPEYSKKKPLVPNAADTSANEQTMVAEAPQPFKNRNTAANISTGAGASGGISTLGPKVASGLTRSAAPRNPSGAAIGQNRMPNQSKQIGGRYGFPPPPKKSGDNSSGYASKRNARFYGE